MYNLEYEPKVESMCLATYSIEKNVDYNVFFFQQQYNTHINATFRSFHFFQN
jgi:hypothetical protein